MFEAKDGKTGLILGMVGAKTGKADMVLGLSGDNLKKLLTLMKPQIEERILNFLAQA